MAIKVFADGANLEACSTCTRTATFRVSRPTRPFEEGRRDGLPRVCQGGPGPHHRCVRSFEVFADDVETMEVEAREIATWAENVYVKIPCVTTKGESTAELVQAFGRRHQGQRHHHLYARAGRRDGRGR
ncbi:MAG: hypothetical protein ACLTYW_03435 [Collinsella sp.]